MAQMESPAQTVSMKEEESELLKVLIRKERELGSFSFRGEGWGDCRTIV